MLLLQRRRLRKRQRRRPLPTTAAACPPPREHYKQVASTSEAAAAAAAAATNKKKKGKKGKGKGGGGAVPKPASTPHEPNCDSTPVTRLGHCDLRGSLPPQTEQRLLVLVGLPGSGKTSVAEALERANWVVVSEEEAEGGGAGSSAAAGDSDREEEAGRRRVDNAVLNALLVGRSVIVDRVNQGRVERRRWLDLAPEAGAERIKSISSSGGGDSSSSSSSSSSYPPPPGDSAIHTLALELRPPVEDCIFAAEKRDRDLRRRSDNEGSGSGEGRSSSRLSAADARRVITELARSLVSPSTTEGFGVVLVAETRQAAAEAVAAIGGSLKIAGVAGSSGPVTAAAAAKAAAGAADAAAAAAEKEARCAPTSRGTPASRASAAAFLAAALGVSKKEALRALEISQGDEDEALEILLMDMKLAEEREEEEAYGYSGFDEFANDDDVGFGGGGVEEPFVREPSPPLVSHSPPPSPPRSPRAASQLAVPGVPLPELPYQPGLSEAEEGLVDVFGYLPREIVVRELRRFHGDVDRAGTSLVENGESLVLALKLEQDRLEQEKAEAAAAAEAAVEAKRRQKAAAKRRKMVYRSGGGEDSSSSACAVSASRNRSGGGEDYGALWQEAEVAREEEEEEEGEGEEGNSDDPNDPRKQRFFAPGETTTAKELALRLGCRVREADWALEAVMDGDPVAAEKLLRSSLIFAVGEEEGSGCKRDRRCSCCFLRQRAQPGGARARRRVEDGDEGRGGAQRRGGGRGREEGAQGGRRGPQGAPGRGSRSEGGRGRAGEEEQAE